MPQKSLSLKCNPPPPLHPPPLQYSCAFFPLLCFTAQMSGFLRSFFNSLHHKSIWQLLQTYIKAYSACTVVHKMHIQHNSWSHLIGLGMFKSNMFFLPFWITNCIGHSVDSNAVGRWCLIKLWPICTQDFLLCGRQCKTTLVWCRRSHPEPHKDLFTVVSAYHKTIHTHSCGFYKSHPAPLHNMAMINLHFHHFRRFNLKLLPFCVH